MWGLWEVGIYTRNTNAIFQVKNVFFLSSIFHERVSYFFFSKNRGEKNGNFEIFAQLFLMFLFTLQADKTMAHEQSPASLYQLNSFYIANRFWNCAERSQRLKNTYFSFSLHSSTRILLTFHLFFYCLGWKQWEKLLCITIWQ